MTGEQLQQLEREILEEHRRDLESLAWLKARFNGAQGVHSAKRFRTAAAVGAAAGAAAAVAPPAARAVIGKGIATRVKELMAEAPDQDWSIAEMVGRLTTEGARFETKTPESTVGIAMRRMVDRGEGKITSGGRGRGPKRFAWATHLFQPRLEANR